MSVSILVCQPHILVCEVSLADLQQSKGELHLWKAKITFKRLFEKIWAVVRVYINISPQNLLKTIFKDLREK